MATAPQILANGQLPNSKGTLFTATGDTVIRLITAVHVAGSTQHVVFYLKKAAGTSRVVGRAQLEVDEFAVDDEVYTLAVGDIIEGQTTDASSVDYTISGAKFS